MNKSLLLLIFFVSLLHVSPIRNSVLISNGYSLFGSFDDPLPPIHVENWHLDRIQASEAMAISNGFSSFSVGFVDSGVDGAITDLSSNLNSILSIDCYGNHSRNPLSQTNSHGTSVVSLFGAKGHYDSSIIGVTQESSMAILRTDKPSNANNFDVDSVIYASSYLNSNQAAIPIFNSSIEFGLFSDFEISQVTSYLSTYSGLGVLIAGNGSGSIDDLCLLEAFSDFYSLPNLLVVGSSNYFDNASVFSNFSSTHVDLFAPGESLSTFPRDGSNNNEPTWFDGTCGAAPLVTGTAALMLSVNPNLTTAQLKSLIMNNVDVDSSKDIYNNCVSHGRLNTYKAVKAAIPEITTLNSFVNGIQSLPAGRHQFYKIVLPEADTYTFETSGNLYTSGYLYGDIQSSPIASSTNQSGNFSLSYYTFKSRSIYLKVVNNSSTSGTYSIKITPSHTTHTYNDHYSWYDGYYHKAYCSCGLYQLKPHIVNGPVGDCIFCNGPYTGLMNNPLLDPVVIGNDSHILSNGTIILGNIDYNLYLSGKLDLDSLIGGETI